MATYMYRKRSCQVFSAFLKQAGRFIWILFMAFTPIIQAGVSYPPDAEWVAHPYARICDDDDPCAAFVSLNEVIKSLKDHEGFLSARQKNIKGIQILSPHLLASSFPDLLTHIVGSEDKDLGAFPKLEVLDLTSAKSSATVFEMHARKILNLLKRPDFRFLVILEANLEECVFGPLFSLMKEESADAIGSVLGKIIWRSETFDLRTDERMPRVPLSFYEKAQVTIPDDKRATVKEAVERSHLSYFDERLNNKPAYREANLPDLKEGHIFYEGSWVSHPREALMPTNWYSSKCPDTERKTVHTALKALDQHQDSCRDGLHGIQINSGLIDDMAFLELMGHISIGEDVYPNLEVLDLSGARITLNSFLKKGNGAYQLLAGYYFLVDVLKRPSFKYLVLNKNYSVSDWAPVLRSLAGIKDKGGIALLQKLIWIDQDYLDREWDTIVYPNQAKEGTDESKKQVAVCELIDQVHREFYAKEFQFIPATLEKGRSAIQALLEEESENASMKDLLQMTPQDFLQSRLQSKSPIYKARMKNKIHGDKDNTETARELLRIAEEHLQKEQPLEALEVLIYLKRKKGAFQKAPDTKRTLYKILGNFWQGEYGHVETDEKKAAAFFRKASKDDPDSSVDVSSI